MPSSIFLSASVPDPKRSPVYHTTADRIAIRDSVMALVTVCLPHMRIVWGGHPAITPLVRVVAERLEVTGADRICIYQSQFFKGLYPSDNAAFERVVKTRAINNDRQQSLIHMRTQMIKSTKFAAGIFIGGMEGVEDEFSLFCDAHPRATVLPIASTGAAAKIIFDRFPERFPTDLESDLAYPSLFRRLLNIPNN